MYRWQVDSIHSACRGLVNDKIKDGINEQRVMDASQEFVIANIGQQHCIEVLTTMNKSSTKCHEEDEQLVAWDDVIGAMLTLISSWKQEKLKWSISRR